MENGKEETAENNIRNTNSSHCVTDIAIKKKVRCAYCYCYREEFRDRIFFRFPKDPSMCRKWVTACKRPYLKNKSPEQLCSSYTICSQHFLLDDFVPPKMCRLKKNACPSLFVSDNETGSSGITLDTSSIKEALVRKLKVPNCLEANGNCFEETRASHMLEEMHKYSPEGDSLKLEPGAFKETSSRDEAANSQCSSHATQFIMSYVNRSEECDASEGVNELFDNTVIGCVPQAICNSSVRHTLQPEEQPFITSTPIKKKSFPSSSGMACKRLKLTDGEQSISCTTPETRKKITKVITPKTRKIKILSTRLHYLKMKLQRLDKAESNRREVLRALKNLLPLPIYSLIQAQIERKNSSPYGRRWTVLDKNFALQIYLASPKAYNVLGKFFNLPSKKTLLKAISSIIVETGFCNVILNALQFISSKMKPHDRLCIVSFDEVKLKPGLSYNEKLDCIIGYESYGIYGENSSKLATHALAFMVRGVCKKWKQVFGYFFSSDGATSSMLKILVMEAIKKLHACGMKPVAVICDQGVHNQKLLRVELGVTPEKPYFMVQSQKVYTIPDPPHLLKCLRNNFKKYDVEFDGKKVATYKKRASWKHIAALYKYDCVQPHRIVPKVTKSHVEVDGFNKMRVSLASQVLSHSVAAGLCCLSSFQYLPAAAANTAEFCADINDIFDSVNSRVIHNKKNPLLSAVTEQSKHFATWDFGKKLFNSMSFDTAGKKINFPCLSGWVLALSAFEQLMPELLSEVSFVLMCRFSQDALENFFSQVRKKGGNNDHPTAADFVNRLRLLLAQNFFNTCGKANCEPDNDVVLLPVNILSTVPRHDLNCSSNSLIVDDVFFNTLTGVEEEQDAVCLNSAAYVAGYLVKQLSITKECSECKNLLTQDKNQSMSTIFIAFKEYEGVACGLCCPSEKLIQTVCVLGKKFNYAFKDTCSIPGIRRRLVEAINDNEVKFDGLLCIKHVDEVWPTILQIYVKLMLHYKVKQLSKNLTNFKKMKKKLKKLD